MDDKYKKELKHQNKDNKKNSKDEIVEELHKIRGVDLPKICLKMIVLSYMMYCANTFDFKYLNIISGICLQKWYLGRVNNKPVLVFCYLFLYKK